MEWKKCKKHNNTFLCEKKFGKYKYLVEVWVEDTSNSLRYWVAVSSGKKRKELDIYEDKPNKSLGGIKALLWIKNAILDFPKFYTREYYTENFKIYLCVRWADSRRRDVYKRLTKYGFYFMHIDNEKTLIKEIYEN